MSEIPVPQDVYFDEHADEHVLGAHDHHVPKDAMFVKVFLLLVVVTAIEVLWAYLPFEDTENNWAHFAYWGGLLGMMSVKFVIIAGTFMHLRFDNKLLTRLFYAGVFLAVGVYAIALCTFQLFSNTPAGFTP
ncbi:cytochrome C oxidase subunit IV family protein [Aquihabitans daechungensis]|uniref:cytochrome C oxidase subunit IV family protein n=1 Tax=Aquihabitans daechungensis TaxID=1052257 RepID=UPI003BA10188